MTQDLTMQGTPTPGGTLAVFGASPQAAPASIAVDVFSDVICPWCYIGSRRLAEAIALFTADAGPAGAVPVQVRWHPFELNPDMPVAGRDRREYRSAKFGSWAHSQQLDAQVAAAGRQDGLQFRHELMARTPNTRAAHRLIWTAQQDGLGQQMVEALFAGYFTQGRDVGDPAVLVELAAKVGLAATAATQAIQASGSAGELTEAGVVAGLARGRALRISGVPFYVFGDAYTLPPGAQPAETIAQVLRVVRQDQHQQQQAAGEQVTAQPPATAVAGPSCDLDGTCR